MTSPPPLFYPGVQSPDNSHSGTSPVAGGVPLGELLTALSSPWKPALVAMELQGRLSVLLRLVLRDRVLWTRPPALLGEDFERWEDWQAAGAMTALTRDCYEFVVIDRFHGLRRLAGGDEILVNKYLLHQVQDFIGQRQRRFDPAGHAVWTNGLAAVVRATEQGFIQLRGRREPLGGHTWLLFGHEEGKREAWEQLHRETGWSQVQKRLGRVEAATQEALALHLARLAGRRVQPCRLRDLLAALQPACRVQSQFHAMEDSGCAGLLVTVLEFIRPDVGFGDWEGWRFWMSQLETDVDVLVESTPARERCRRLLDALLWYVEADQLPPEPPRLARELDIRPVELAEDLRVLATATVRHDPTRVPPR